MLLWASLTLRLTDTFSFFWGGGHYCICKKYLIFSQLITSNFTSVLIVFHHFIIWIGLADEDIHFSLNVETKTNIVGELHQPYDDITKVINPYTWLMAWQWHHFLLPANTRQVWPWMVYAKSHTNKIYRLSSVPNCVKPKFITSVQKVV